MFYVHIHTESVSKNAWFLAVINFPYTVSLQVSRSIRSLLILYEITTGRYLTSDAQ